MMSVHHHRPVPGLYCFRLNSVFQGLAGFEFYHTAGFNFNWITGLGVSSGSGFPANFSKGAEADEGYFAVFFLQRFADTVHE